MLFYWKGTDRNLLDVFVAWLRFVGRYRVLEGNLIDVRCPILLR